MSRSSPAASEPADPMDPLAGPRMAALLLHAMPTESRVWVLSQLHGEQRKSLQELLAELQDLGIPADRTLLSEVLSTGTASSRGAAPQNDAEEQRAIVARADPGSIWLLLRDEPAGLIAWVVVLFGDRWADTFLEHLDAHKRGQVVALVGRYRQEGWGRSVVPDQLRAHLLATLSARLSELHIRWVLDQTLQFPGPRRARKWWRPALGATGANSLADRFRL
jgi:hypothetical protein